MADKSNYADKATDTGAVPEHRLYFGNDCRAFTPYAGETDGEGLYGNLAVSSTGDWSWKPERYRQDKGISWTEAEIREAYPNGYEPNVPTPASARARHDAQLAKLMPTFHGVPKGAAELYGRSAYRIQA